jgi:metal-dependent hydrolase (beta-lactamase superfamily II)
MVYNLEMKIIIIYDNTWFLKTLEDDGEFICPCHCTRYKKEIKSRCPGKYIEGGAGKIIDLEYKKR